MSDERIEIEEDVTPEDVLGADEDQTNLENEESEPDQPTDGGDEDTTDEQPEEPVADEPDADADVESAPETVPYKVSYGGQEFEIQVTPQQAQVLDAQKTTALQFPHLQRKYQEFQSEYQVLLNRTQQAAHLASAKMTPDQQDAGQQFDANAFVERMMPVVDDAVKRGAVSEEFKELYPVEAATGAWLAVQLEQVGSVLNPIVQQFSMSARDAQRSQFRAEIYDSMQHLASSNPDLYGDLNDNNNREKFLDFLIELDVKIEHLLGENRPKTLEKLWPSFQGPQLLQAASAANKRAQNQQKEKRRNAGGGGGSAGSRSKPQTGLEDIMATLKD